jgi:prophage regulatory protein
MSVNHNFLRPPQAAKKLGVGLSTLWEKVRLDPEFPRPLKLSTRTTVFVEGELDGYMEKLIRVLREKAPQSKTAA